MRVPACGMKRSVHGGDERGNAKRVRTDCELVESWVVSTRGLMNVERTHARRTTKIEYICVSWYTEFFIHIFERVYIILEY